MILAIDVGNTNITIGVFQQKELKGVYRMTSSPVRTSDEYGIWLCSLLEHQGIDPKGIEHVVTSSVVPDVMYSLNSGVIKYFNVRPIIVGPGIKTGIKLVTANPKEIGADRIVDAVAAYSLYGGPVI